MTILGAHVLAPDLGVAWADSEVFDADDRSIGFVGKLAVNPAGFVFTMAGWHSVGSRAASCVVDASDIGTALRRLPRVLRRVSKHAATVSRQPELHGTQHAALIGFDPEAGRVVAYRLTAGECFVPLLDHQQATPWPAQSGTIPDGPHMVELIARKQMARLREVIPHAKGGGLHVAIIRPTGITCSRLCDLGEDRVPATAQIEKEAA